MQALSLPGESKKADQPPVQIIGRTGSLFTRVALIFAEEAGVEYELIRLNDLIATDLASYSGNPTLRIPVLRVSDQVLFGTQNICRMLAGRSTRPLHIIWPENLTGVLLMNTQEVIWQSMLTQVQLLMVMDYGKPFKDNQFVTKALTGFEGSLQWLDRNVTEIIAALPQDRTVSMLEVGLYCLVEHLQFGPTVPIEQHSSLLTFARTFGMRTSAQRTAFR